MERRSRRTRCYALLDTALTGLANLPAAAWVTFGGTLVSGMMIFATLERDQWCQKKDTVGKTRQEMALAVSILQETAKKYSRIGHIR